MSNCAGCADPDGPAEHADWCKAWPKAWAKEAQKVDPRNDPERRASVAIDEAERRLFKVHQEAEAAIRREIAARTEAMFIEPKAKPERSVGIGGAPNRATTLPEDSAERKQYPIATGVLDYFPDAIVAIAHLSWKGNEQHNPGQEVHWARGKSMNEADTMMRHFLQRGTLDADGVRHSAKLAWRALALLQKEIEADTEKEEAA